MATRLAVDIGGTFTDIVSYDTGGGAHRTTKTLTRKADLIAGVLHGVDRLVGNADEVGFFVHGTTVGLNALLERRGSAVALLTTSGFRDVYEIGRANRPEMYNLFYRRPAPLVRRRDVYEAVERTLADGSVARELEPESLEPLVERLAGGGYDAVAICFLHAYANPANEQRARDLLLERFPNLSVSLSSDLSREWREYERTSTVVMNGYIAPVVETYLDALTSRMSDAGVRATPYVMQSNGGLMTVDQASRQCVQTLFSGPVGGTIASRSLGRLIGAENLICVDLGGTSFDVSLVIGGEADVATETSLEGFPILMPSVPMHTIGAGGGSIAWVEQGALRVGPRSAGSDPGPVCYGLGGSEPTLTDANVVLGRIDGEYFLGGEMKLDVPAATAALDGLAAELDLTTDALAEGITRIVHVKMGNAIRAVTIKRGLDPRDFTLVAFGGAGPLHAALLADEVDIAQVVIPASPGTFSAWGMLQCDIRRDFAQTYYAALGDVDPTDLERSFRELEDGARAALASEGVPPEATILARTIDMRYSGQEYFLSLPLDADLSQNGLETLAARFHETYQQRYGHSNVDEELETVNLRIAAIGTLERSLPSKEPTVATRPRPEGHREVGYDGDRVAVPVYRRSALEPGHETTAMAIVEEPSCTTFVPRGWSARVDEYRNLVLTRSP